MVAVNFCVMVVAPWVSDLLLAWGAGRWHGVRVAGMGCGVWVWLCGLPACVVAEVWGKKNGYGCVGCRYVCWESVGKKINILIGK